MPHDEEVPEEERMWPDCAQGGAEEESSDRRLPGQELATERGFRVGRRMVSKGILSGDSGIYIFHKTGKKRRWRVPGFQLSERMDSRPREVKEKRNQ